MSGKAGRPRNKYTPDQERAVEQAARVNCTNEEIADISGIPRSTLERDFGQTIEKIRVNAKESLRRAQFKAAIEGNPTMLIWLGKQWLKQKDKHEYSGPDEGPIQVQDVTDVRKRCANVARKILDGLPESSDIAMGGSRDSHDQGVDSE